MSKTFTIVPRGVALVIGCNTFPTWNSYPGLFAGLATGNAVLVKPHPRAVLPLAITVRIVREVLAEHGFDPDLVRLAAEPPGGRLAAELAVRPEVGIVDYTGSTSFGDWLEEHARQAQVYTEKAGVNTVVVDSTDDYRGMLSNLAFSLVALQRARCAPPRRTSWSRGTGSAPTPGHVVRRASAGTWARRVDGLLGDDARRPTLLGAVVNDDVLRPAGERPVASARSSLASRSVPPPAFPTPPCAPRRCVKVDVADDEGATSRNASARSPSSSRPRRPRSRSSCSAGRSAASGAITAAVHSTDEACSSAAARRRSTSGSPCR